MLDLHHTPPGRSVNNRRRKESKRIKTAVALVENEQNEQHSFLQKRRPRNNGMSVCLVDAGT